MKPLITTATGADIPKLIGLPGIEFHEHRGWQGTRPGARRLML